MPKCQTNRRDKHCPYDAALGLRSGSEKPHLRDLVCQGRTQFQAEINMNSSFEQGRNVTCSRMVDRSSIMTFCGSLTLYYVLEATQKSLIISRISVQRPFVRATHLLRTKKITSATTTTAPIIPAISSQLSDDGICTKLAVTE